MYSFSRTLGKKKTIYNNKVFRFKNFYRFDCSVTVCIFLIHYRKDGPTPYAQTCQRWQKLPFIFHELNISQTAVVFPKERKYELVFDGILRSRGCTFTRFGDKLLLLLVALWSKNILLWQFLCQSDYANILSYDNLFTT